MVTSIYDEPDYGLSFPLPLSEEEDRFPVKVCPGCANPVSEQERLTGRCAKDGLPLDEDRHEVVLPEFPDHTACGDPEQHDAHWSADLSTFCYGGT